MKAMIRKLLTITLLAFFSCCTFKKNLNKPVLLSYKSQNIEVDFEIKEKMEVKKQSWEKDGNRYFYFGSISVKLGSKEKPKEIKLLYKDESSEVYLDTIASTTNFWDTDWYDSNNFRKDKAYIVFDDPNVDWGKVKLIELDISKSMTREDVCKMLKEKSSQNYKKSCL